MAKHKMGERQIARILALIANEALPAEEISKRLYMCASSVTRFIQILLAEKTRRLYVAGWIPGRYSKPVRLLRAGSEKDVPYILKRHRKKVDGRVVQANKRRAEILALLAMPQTSHQLAARMGISRSTVMNYMREHKAARRVHIKGWVLPVEQGSQSPVYALGDHPNKPRTRRGRQKAIKPAWAPMLTTLMVGEVAQDRLPQAA